METETKKFQKPFTVYHYSLLFIQVQSSVLQPPLTEEHKLRLRKMLEELSLQTPAQSSTSTSTSTVLYPSPAPKTHLHTPTHSHTPMNHSKHRNADTTIRDLHSRLVRVRIIVIRNERAVINCIPQQPGGDVAVYATNELF